MRMQEMTEDEQRTLRAGLRMIARLVARRHLARREAEAAAANPDHEDAGASADGASQSGVKR